LQAAPNLDLAALKNDLAALRQVSRVDALKVWSLDGAHHVASVQISISPNLSAEDRRTLKIAVRDVFSQFGEFDTNIEWIEPA